MLVILVMGVAALRLDGGQNGLAREAEIFRSEPIPAFPSRRPSEFRQADRPPKFHSGLRRERGASTCSFAENWSQIGTSENLCALQTASVVTYVVDGLHN